MIYFYDWFKIEGHEWVASWKVMYYVGDVCVGYLAR